jgi:hypothetical protein
MRRVEESSAAPALLSAGMVVLDDLLCVGLADT